MSLLDLTNDPQRMGLLSLGLNLMQAKGNLGQAFGQAGQAALSDMIAAQALNQQGEDRKRRLALDEQQQMMTSLQLQQAIQAQQAKQAEARQAAEVAQRRGSYLGSIDPNAGPAMPFNPASAFAAGLSTQEVQALTPPEPKKQDLEALIIPGPDGKPMINPLALEARRQISAAGRAPAAAAPATPAPPKLSAAAERVEIDRAKAGQQSQQMMAAIQEARSLLGSKPTESGIGAGVDWLGRQVGMSSDSARKAAQLETLSGWMVANVPRMEGPQSNFDILNYQTMAAKVGDRTVPVDERLAALQTLEQLHRRYADINGTPLPDGPRINPNMPGTVVDFGSLK